MILLKKILNKSISVLTILFIIFLIDLIINLILSENIKKTIGTTMNYSLKSEMFHHEIAPNINLLEFWGNKKYKVITNNFGMRIGENDFINSKIKNIGFIGDSFVYGSGIDYNNHFITLIKKNNKDYNYLNLGYVSYSPSIYYKKLKYFLDNKNLEFDKIFIFVDTSDIQDEGSFYREDSNGNIVRKWNSDLENKKKNFKYRYKNYLKQNSFIFKFYEIFSFNNTNEQAKKCLSEKENVNLEYIKYLDYERFGYAYDETLYSKKWVKEGQKKIIDYLSKIKKLLDLNKIEMIIVHFPSAIDVLKDNKIKDNSKHYQMLNNWAQLNYVSLIDTQEDFFKTKNPIKNYEKNHIACDVHWNSSGHKIIGKNILKYITN